MTRMHYNRMRTVSRTCRLLRVRRDGVGEAKNLLCLLVVQVEEGGGRFRYVTHVGVSVT